jgi:hypothetical protein
MPSLTTCFSSLASRGVEHRFYTRSRGGDQLIIEVYVDDLIITSTNDEGIDEFKRHMKERFQMSGLVLRSYYLNIEIVQDQAGINLYHSTYIGKLLDKCSLGSCSSTATPMENRLKLSKSNIKPAVNATEYQSIVGALRYLFHT